MLYILLPVFNEEAHIRKLIEDIEAALSGQSFKIIIVNDGSTDRTVEIVKEMDRSHVVLLSHSINLSIGAVFCTGLNYAVGEASDDDTLVLMESDLTSPAFMIKQLQEEIKTGNKDVVIASRYLNKGGYKNFPWMRTLFSLGANAMMRFFFPIEGIKDYTIFLRGYRVKVLKEVNSYFGAFNCLQTKGFVSNAELLIKCSLFTNKMGEIPFIYNYVLKKNPSKMRILGTILEYFSFVLYMQEIIKKVDLRRNN